MNISEKIEESFLQNRPFVVYNKPNSTEVKAFFSDSILSEIPDFNASGFIIQSFDNSSQCFFSAEKSEVLTENICQWIQDKCDNQQIEIPLSQDDSLSHCQLVSKGIDWIKKGNAQKIVLSRREELIIDLTKKVNYFQKILEFYPTAFCYWWYIPNVGEWMGATPELLLQKKQDIIYTVSLAGTQVDNGQKEVYWGEKEKEEQQIVTDFIVNSLKPFVVATEISPVYTYKAGVLLHLKTDISAKIQSQDKFKDILFALHPTPALCGMPKEKAKQFIIQNEGYPREYYSGFLGELNNTYENQSNSEIYVNLRCMQFKSNMAYLYLGGGITSDSNPLAEYKETVNKSNTMKRVLYK